MNFKKVIGLILQGIGALALVGLAVVAFLVFREARLYETDASKPFTRDELAAPMNWAGVDASQAWSIIASSKSERSFTGDHSDYACLQLERFDPDARSGWQSDQESDGVLTTALQTALARRTQQDENCLPTQAVANSTAITRNFRQVVISDRAPTAAIIFLYQPATKRLFYLDFKT